MSKKTSTIIVIGNQPHKQIIDKPNTDNYDARICKCGQTNPKNACCFNNFNSHLTSPYCITEYCAKPDNDHDPCCDIFMTCIFCPIKFVFTWSCCIGSVINGCINKCKHTDNNYLC